MPSIRTLITTHRWPRLALGSLAGALFVGGITFGLEARSLLEAELSPWEAAIVAAPAALLVVVLGTVVGSAAATLLTSKPGGAFPARSPSWNGLLRSCVSLVLFGYAAYGVTRAAQAFLSAEGTRAIATAWLLVPTFFIVNALARLIVRRVGEHFRNQPTALQTASIVTLVPLLWAFSLFVTEPEVFVGISGFDWTPFVLSPVVSVFAALLVPARRALIIVEAAALLSLFSLGFARLLSDNSSRIELAMLEHSRTTRLLAETFEGVLSSDPAPARAPDGKGGSCWPGREQAPLSALSKVDESAKDILLVMFDGVRWDRTSLGGYEKNTTPNLAKWAKHAVVFERAYAISASTRQTFRSLLTGLMPSQIAPSKGKTKWSLSFPEAQLTLADYLQAAGYETISIQTTRAIDEEGTKGLPGFEVRDFAPFHARRDLGYSANVHIDRVIAHLSQPGRKRPRFVFTHMMETHQPFIPGPHPKHFGKGRTGRYDSALHLIDRQLGRIIEFATSPERRDHTILILAADHGMGLGERGGMKQHGNSLYDDQTRVPLLFFGPGFEPGRVEEPATLLDLFPTIVDLAGLEELSHTCGSSLLPVLRGEREYEARPVVVEIFPDAANPKFRIAYVEGNHKLMLDVKGKSRHVYDLHADPEEANDLSSSEPETLRRLETGLRRFVSERGLEAATYDLGD